MNRRSFFKRLGLTALPALGFPAVVRSSAEVRAFPGEKPRRIIHVVADGMSLGTLSCADHFSLHRRGRPLSWVRTPRQPSASLAWVNMRSLNSLVTDSAAASSSWGSGSRVTNGALNWLPDGRVLRSLYSLLAEQGWKRGLVTTTEITHATPAGFASTISSRDKSDRIAEQYLENRVEVLLGGGHKFFDAEKRADHRNLLQDYRDQGYTICTTADGLRTAPKDQRCLGLFASSHLPFSLDLTGDPKARALVPTLAEMTQAALDILDRESFFILQVEGGRVDHACHNNDIASAVHEVIGLDEAIDVCLAYQRRVPETLIIMTVDHGNGNPGLGGYGHNDGAGRGAMARLEQVQKSFPEILKTISASTDPAKIRERLLETTGCLTSLERVKTFARFLDKKHPPLNDALNSTTSQLGQLLGHYLGIGWGSSSHTSDYVPLVAVGPGAEHFRGQLENTDVFAHYLALAKVDYQNPRLPLISDVPEGSLATENIAAYELSCDGLPA